MLDKFGYNLTAFFINLLSNFVLVISKASLLLVAVLLLKEEQSDIVVDSDEVLAVADGFVTMSGFLLQLYKVLLDTILDDNKILSHLLQLCYR